jgi:hypothetical protein
MGRWGEKVPAAVGTVANGFALLQLCALNMKGTFLAAEQTEASALGTGLLLAQGGSLLFEKALQRSLSESSGGGAGELLHGLQIDVKTGTLVTEGASGDDFAPLGSESLEFLELLGSEGAAWHGASCIGVKTMVPEKMVSVNLRLRT